MIFSRNPARGSRILNAVALLGVTAILCMAFVWQFAYDELPCPLYLLQRVALMLAGCMTLWCSLWAEGLAADDLRPEK